MGEDTRADVVTWRLRDVADAATELPLENQSERLQNALAGLAAAHSGQTCGTSDDD
jgi:hypothetical protein